MSGGRRTRTAFDRVDVMLGSDGDGYYTLVYPNGRRGPRSEGYKGRTDAEALRGAERAALRDFPDLEVRRV